MENYLVMETDNTMRWIQVERSEMRKEFRRVIGCDCLESVRTLVPDVVLLIDESGQVKTPPQQHNELASRLYLGYYLDHADIAGPAVVGSVGYVDGDLDFVPLDNRSLFNLRISGFDIPPRPVKRSEPFDALAFLTETE